MMKQIFKTIAVLGLVTFAGQASADTIRANWGSAVGDASADFRWEVKADGELVIAITNNSAYSGSITSLRFILGGDGAIDELVSVSGTQADGMWAHNTDTFSCRIIADCMTTGSHFWNGDAGHGVAAGSTARFRFAGDFSGLTEINWVALRFHGTGSDGWGHGTGLGCRRGCEASEVPEPGTLMMFAAGLLGFGLVARRRRLI